MYTLFRDITHTTDEEKREFIKGFNHKGAEEELADGFEAYGYCCAEAARDWHDSQKLLGPYMNLDEDNVNPIYWSWLKGMLLRFASDLGRDI